MPYPELIELGAVRLERWDAQAHRAAFEAMREDPEVTRFLDFLLTEDARDFSDAQAAHWERHGHGLWAVVSPAAGPQGWIGAVHPRWHPEFADQVELAWGLCRPLWGAGVATRGARAAAQACFDEIGLESVMAFFEPENARSIAVGQRLGMQPTGETTEPKTDLRLLTYGLTADRMQ
jgi:RimJ/RimL family protein N-acetyltransferase